MDVLKNVKIETKNTNLKTPLLYAESNRITCAELSRSIGRGWGRLFLLLAFIGLSTANAQVGIGTDDPDPSAILEVDVSSLTDKQGFLPPRLSSAERDAIASPPQGLTIFNTTTNAIEFSDGTNWINLNDNSTVAVNGATAPSGNGDVGIGTETPDANAALDIVSTDRGFLPPRITTAERDAIASPTKGLVIFNETTTCLQWYDGDFWFDGCTGSEGPDPLPGNITLEEISAYFIASADDTDYLDGSGALPNNTTEAQLPGTAADDEADGATTETAIDIQGTLTTTGVTINIPYEVVNASTTLPAFEQTITIPAEYTQTGASAVDIKFSYPEQTNLAIGTGVVPATLEAVGTDLDVIKFDLNSGFGADYLGFLLGKFVYALDSAGTYADFEVRGIPGIPDKNIGDGVHDFIYLPITSTPTGKTWLNNNLGANYANINDAAFDPAEQATVSADEDAYGSLFQWGRVADGHEIIDWTSSTSGNPEQTTTNSTSSTPEPATSEFITSGSANWYTGSSPAANDLWQENTKTTYDPCPNGYRVPTEAEWQAEIDNGSNPSWSNASDAFSSDLALPVAGNRSLDTGGLNGVGSSGVYWSSTVSGSSARRLNFYSSGAFMNAFSRADGVSVRCLKD